MSRSTAGIVILARHLGAALSASLGRSASRDGVRVSGFVVGAGRCTTSAPARSPRSPNPLGDSKRVAADDYVYAMTDYREVDRSISLARVKANVSEASIASTPRRRRSSAVMIDQC
jgi:hypothetical protein